MAVHRMEAPTARPPFARAASQFPPEEADTETIKVIFHEWRR
jgi:hypothetical protein